MAQLGSFPLLRLRARWRLEAPLWLVGFRGNAFRGALSVALRGLVCSWPDRACETCEDRSRCVWVFLTRTSANHRLLSAGGVSTPTPPMTLAPDAAPDCLPLGAAVGMAVTLVGPAINCARYVAGAFERMRLGSSSAGLRLAGAEYIHRDGAVTAWDARHGARFPQPFDATLSSTADLTPPPLGQRLLIQMVTPLQLRSREGQGTAPSDKKLKRLPVTRIGFEGFIESACRRLGVLSVHTPGVAPLTFDQVRPLVEQCQTLSSELSYQRGEAGGPERRHPVHGIVGRLCVEGPWRELWPLLKLAEAVNVGEGAARGLGVVKIKLAGSDGAPAGR